MVEDNFEFSQVSVPRFYGVLVGTKRVEPHEFLDAWFGAYVCCISIKIYCHDN